MVAMRFTISTGPSGVCPVNRCSRASSQSAVVSLAGAADQDRLIDVEQLDIDTGDSVASRYAAEVDAMVEVRNLRQLETFIAKTL